MKQGWELKKLGDICDLQNGFAFKSNDYIEFSNTMNFRMSQIRPGGGIDLENNPKYLPDDYAVKYKDYLLKEGDVVIAMTDLATETKILGVPTIVPKDNRNWLLNQRVGKLFKIDVLIVDVAYLKYILSSTSVNEYYKSLGRGGLQINIGKQDILNAKIPLPPLPEQQRIVAILDEAFAAIAQAKANAEQNLKNAKELFESYLQSVFENKGEGWEEKTLGEMIELLVGFAFKSKDYTEVEDDILLLRGDNIMQGYLRLDDVKRWSKLEFETYKKYQLQENDILLAMDRPWVKAGLKIAKISNKNIPALLVQRTACLRTKSNLDNSFLFYLLKSNGFMKYLIDVQTGIGVPHISGKQILDFSFTTPPLKEQQAIVQKLDALSTETKQLAAIYQQKINDLDELKKSILQKAFAGELC
ncbi:MAG: restriction endonuclease subunit S [Methylococcaceae bacterium]